LALGFGAGFAHEAAMIALAVLDIRSIEPRWAAGLPPAVTAWLWGVATMLLIGGALSYLSKSPELGSRYLRTVAPVHALAAMAAFVALVSLPGFAPLGVPRPLYGGFLAALSLPLSAIGAALAIRHVPRGARWSLLTGLFFVSLAGLIPLIAETRVNPLEPPFGHNYASLARAIGAVLFGYLSIRTNAAGARNAFGVLEDEVRQRTAHLEAALADLSVANSKLVEQSTIDSLTGARNRRFFDEALSLEWSRAARARQPLALAFVDLDQFKAINDRFGHPMGDECLRCVATILQGRLRRPGDIVARYGGDEFAVLLANTSKAAAQDLLEDIRLRIENLTVAPEAGLSISVGVASAVPRPGEEPASLVQRADERLYAAKQAGRNQVSAGAASAAEFA
jgi:diguanylate cyclase (GGDEF)-like protein